MARDVYIAIMVASAKGVGLRLTPEELDDLALDDAIASRAANALTEQEHNLISEAEGYTGWELINPRKPREPWQGNCRDPRGRMAV